MAAGVAAVAVLVAAPAGRPLETTFEIYSVTSNGTGRLDLSNHPANDAFPAESPRGGRIAFVSDRDGYDAIYVMNDDGSDQRRLTDRITHEEHGNCQLIAPVWSPDGSTIAFGAHCLLTEYGDPRQARYWIHAVSSSGGPARELIPNGFGPVYSADGRYLAFTHQISPYAPASVALATASGERQTVFEFGRASAWSPTGHRLAFVTGRGGVAVVDAARPGKKWMLGSRLSLSPSWSPRGNVLAYFLGGSRPGIYVAHPPSRHVSRLVDLGEEASIDWAPNGRWLVLQGGAATYVVRNDGRFLQALTDPSGPLSWSPDSSRFAWVASGWLVVSKPRGDSVLADGNPGDFTSVIWTADSRRIVYARR